MESRAYFGALLLNRHCSLRLNDQEQRLDRQRKLMYNQIWKQKEQLLDDYIQINVRTPSPQKIHETSAASDYAKSGIWVLSDESAEPVIKKKHISPESDYNEVRETFAAADSQKYTSLDFPQNREHRLHEMENLKLQEQKYSAVNSSASVSATGLSSQLKRDASYSDRKYPPKIPEITHTDRTKEALVSLSPQEFHRQRSTHSSAHFNSCKTRGSRLSSDDKPADPKASKSVVRKPSSSQSVRSQNTSCPSGRTLISRSEWGQRRSSRPIVKVVPSPSQISRASATLAHHRKEFSEGTVVVSSCQARRRVSSVPSERPHLYENDKHPALETPRLAQDTQSQSRVKVDTNQSRESQLTRLLLKTSSVGAPELNNLSGFLQKNSGRNDRESSISLSPDTEKKSEQVHTKAPNPQKKNSKRNVFNDNPPVYKWNSEDTCKRHLPIADDESMLLHDNSPDPGQSGRRSTVPSMTLDPKLVLPLSAKRYRYRRQTTITPVIAVYGHQATLYPNTEARVGRVVCLDRRTRGWLERSTCILTCLEKIRSNPQRPSSSITPTNHTEMPPHFTVFIR